LVIGKFSLALVFAFLLIIAINNAEAVYTDCEREVDEDESITFAEKTVQKKNCNTYGNRYAEVSCPEPFSISIRAAEGQGTFVDNVIDLGTIMHFDGVGACNSDVTISLEKDGVQFMPPFLQRGFSEGVFGDQFFFSQFADEGNYKLTAVNENTGEISIVEFSVKQLDNPSNPNQAVFFNNDETSEQINELKAEIESLKEELAKKDAVLMEQVKVIMDLANMITNTIYEQFFSLFTF